MYAVRNTVRRQDSEPRPTVLLRFRTTRWVHLRRQTSESHGGFVQGQSVPFLQYSATLKRVVRGMSRRRWMFKGSLVVRIPHKMNSNALHVMRERKFLSLYASKTLNRSARHSHSADLPFHLHSPWLFFANHVKVYPFAAGGGPCKPDIHSGRCPEDRRCHRRGCCQDIQRHPASAIYPR